MVIINGLTKTLAIWLIHLTYSTRLVDTSFDLMPMFKAGDASDIKTKDFIDNYTVFISDRQLVTKARLNILYCE
jgi:hypothetical protein